ncbi:primosomal protein DnaI [Fusobacterium varium]|nr:primosomal protein DnaI [Fusobacterium varium]
MKKCEFCGKEYIKNQINLLPKSIRANLEFIPNCSCRIEQDMKIQNEKWEEDLIKSRLKKYSNASIIKENISNFRFENTNINMDKTDIHDRHLRIGLKFVTEFLKNKNMKGGIYFYGSVGTGKTYTTACIANKLIENSYTVLILNLGLYFLKLRSEWAEGELETLKLVEKCDLLIIDDLGTEKVSEFVLEKTFNLIDRRCVAKKPMIISSNLSLDEVAKTYNDRIADRIKEICVQVNVEGKSKRKPIQDWLIA